MTDDFSQFYTGFVAEHYDRFIPEDEATSTRFFRRFVMEGRGPALELACGTGRPMLDFIADGFDVDGLDASADMLAQCRRKASARGLEVALHQAPMQAFSIGKRYQTLYVVSGSFNLLQGDVDVGKALACAHGHLNEGGRIAVELELPRDPGPKARERWYPFREAQDGDVTVRCSSRVEDVDPVAQQFISALRYEAFRGADRIHEEIRRFTLQWHTQDQFRSRLETAGFESISFVNDDGNPAAPDSSTFIAHATRR